jgi:hypothetical protein
MFFWPVRFDTHKESKRIMATKHHVRSRSRRCRRHGNGNRRWTITPIGIDTTTLLSCGGKKKKSGVHPLNGKHMCCVKKANFGCRIKLGLILLIVVYPENNYGSSHDGLPGKKTCIRNHASPHTSKHQATQNPNHLRPIRSHGKKNLATAEHF